MPVIITFLVNFTNYNDVALLFYDMLILFVNFQGNTSLLCQPATEFLPMIDEVGNCI